MAYAVVKIIDVFAASKVAFDLTLWIRILYFFAFAFILLLSAVNNEMILDQLGFLKGTFSKGLFYIFCAFLCFGGFDDWLGVVAGCAIAAGGAFNILRFFGKVEDTRNNEAMV